jgi:hypothetical protein
MLTAEHKSAMGKFTATHNGNKLDQAKLLKPSPLIAKVLVARIASMTPEQQASMKGILTPETKDALKVLIPEFSGIMEKKLEGNTASGTGAGNAGTAG